MNPMTKQVFKYCLVTLVACLRVLLIRQNAMLGDKTEWRGGRV